MTQSHSSLNFPLLSALYSELKETMIAEFFRSETSDAKIALETSSESDKIEWPIDSDHEEVVRKPETVKLKPQQIDIVIPKKVASLYNKSNFKAVARKDKKTETKTNSNKLWSVVGTNTAENSVTRFDEFEKAREAAVFVTSLVNKNVESVVPTRKKCLEQPVPEKVAKIREQADLISQNRKNVKEVSSKAVSVLKKNYEQKTKMRSQQITRLEEKKSMEMMASLKAIRKRYDPQEVV